MPIRFRFAALLLAAVIAGPAAFADSGARSLIPDTGRVAVQIRAHELTNPLRVLMVSLRPGDEDLQALAHFRFGRGAQVLSAFVTNGESGEHDAVGMLPRQLAAVRRNATTTALGQLEVDVRFLNFPDPGSVRDDAGVGGLLPADSLRESLRGIVSTIKPHIVLLSRDWEGGAESPLWRHVLTVLREVVKPGHLRKSPLPVVVEKERDPWHVSRFWVDDGKPKGVLLQQTKIAPEPARYIRSITPELESAYSWQYIQRRARASSQKYSVVLSPGEKRARSLDEQVDLQVPRDLKGLSGVIQSYGRDIQTKRLPRAELLRRTVKVMDSVDQALGTTIERSGIRMRMLLDWKGTLENLRNALLGITVDYSLSENVLTERQLTHIRIHSVTGLPEGGTTDVYFPSAERGWILNEGIRNRLPLTVPGEYRVISPEKVLYDLPWAEHNLEHPVTTRPVMLFLLHTGRIREENFVYRISLPIRYAPRLAAEVLTPLVRCIEGEFLVTRLTNNSRDGLRDTILVDDIIVQSPAKVVRLNEKGLSQTDTLHLHWRDSLSAGMYLAPLTLGGIEVARFAARKFDLDVDTTMRVGLFTSIEASPTADALRRMGLSSVRTFRTAAGLSAARDDLDVLLIDRRVTTLSPDAPRIRPIVDQIAERGGHIIILAQDASAWNSTPLWDMVHLEHNPTLSPDVPAIMDTTHELMSTPNILEKSAFEDWVFASGYNTVKISGGSKVDTPVWYDSKHPLLVTALDGNGRKTYADLAFGPQWMSIHPGAFRILANLLSMRTTRDGSHR